MRFAGSARDMPTPDGASCWVQTPALISCDARHFAGQIPHRVQPALLLKPLTQFTNDEGCRTNIAGKADRDVAGQGDDLLQTIIEQDAR
jgi:hypothetical protein